MANIKPFRAIRPVRDKSSLVSVWSYSTYTKAMIKARMESNPFCFLHIIHPGFKDGLEEGGLFRFKLIKKRFEDFKEKQILKRDKKACFYIYSQITDENEFSGIIAVASVDDYYYSVIKKHEQTITNREKLFKEYLKTTKFNAEPVLISYPKNYSIDYIINKYTKERSEYEFSTTNGFIHKLWVVEDRQDINYIRKQFKNIDNMYIADGHHRSASSALLSEELKKQVVDSEYRPFNYFMALLVSEDNLKIYSFNRLIRDLNGFSPEEFILEIEKKFEIEKLETPIKPSDNKTFLMYMDGIFYKLTLKNYKEDKNNPLSSLPPHILAKNILEPILNIKDPKNDIRIDFQSEKEGLKLMEKKVDSGEFKVAFASYPVNFSQIKNVSDKEMIMPPKSTYIEPKLRTGLVIYDIFNG